MCKYMHTQHGQRIQSSSLCVQTTSGFINSFPVYQQQLLLCACMFVNAVEVYACIFIYSLANVCLCRFPTCVMLALSFTAMTQ